MIFLSERLPDDAVVFIKEFISKFTDTEYETLTQNSVIGKLSYKAMYPDVELVFLDKGMYELCSSKSIEILDTVKVHRYVDINSLEVFLKDFYGDSELVVNIDEDLLVSQGQSESELEEEINSLKVQLSTAQFTISNLQAQIAQHDDGEINDLVQTIAELRRELEEKDEALRDNSVEAISQEDYSLVKEELTRVQSKNEELSTKLEAQTGTITALENDNANLRDDCSGLKSKVEELSIRNAQYETANTELKTTLKDVDTQLKQMQDESTEKLDLVNELSEKSKALEALQEQYDIIVDDLGTANKSITSLKDEVTGLDNLCKDKGAEIDNLKGTIDDCLSTYKLTTQELNDEISQLKDKLKTQEGLTEVAESEVTKHQGEISQLKDDLRIQKGLTEDFMSKTLEVQNENCQLKASLEIQEDLNNELKAKVDTLEVKLDDKDEYYINKMKSIEDDLKEKLDDKDKDCTSKIKSIEDDLNERLDEVASLKKDLKEKVAEIASLNKDLKASAEREKLGNDAIIENAKLRGTITTLEQQEEKLRNKNSEQANEITRLKTSEINGSVVARLQDELAKCNNKLTTNEKLYADKEMRLNGNIKLLQAELKDARQEATDIRTELTQTKAKLTEIRNSVFTSLSDVSKPKNSISILLKTPDKVYNNMYAVASGSPESDALLYSTLSKHAKANPKKSFLIVDLAHQTYIDREFVINKVVSPIAWLQGTDTPDKYLASTGLSNVKVMATSLNYFNELAFLEVSWVQRLEELSHMADTVIISVGSLGGIVTGILFSSFTKAMRGNVIVKTSPISLRTAIVNLSGLTNCKTLTVSCSEPTVASEKLFNSLKAKWEDVRILNEGTSIF